MSVSYIYQLEIENKRLKEKIEKLDKTINKFDVISQISYMLLRDELKKILNDNK